MAKRRGKYVHTRSVHQRDLNEEELRWHLHNEGCSTELIMGQNGCFDMMVDYDGLTFVVEVKRQRGRLSKTQRLWQATWTGFSYVLRNPEEIPAMLQAVRKHYSEVLLRHMKEAQGG